MLILFDIDQTLIHTGGAGIRALQKSFREVFVLAEDHPISLDLAGATDSGIYREFVEQHGWQDRAPAAEHFFNRYISHLEIELPRRGDGRVLDGVAELLEILHPSPSHQLALLTGNIRAGAESKLRHFGLARYFDFDLGSYGDDHHDRNALGPVVRHRVAEKTGILHHPDDILVIGDTPKDIRCAQAMGANVLAVATGKHGIDELTAAGADHVLENLAQPEKIARILGL